MPLTIVFAGTPEFAAVHLRALVQSEHKVIAAYTQPDRPAGRGKKLQASDVKKVALEHDIPVYQPLNFRDDADVQALAALNADVMVVVAYGLLLPQSVLDTPKHGCLNVHGSLLPRWRGAAPIQRCIEAGDTETGITIMQMNAGLDTGDMLYKTQLTLNADETGGSLHDRLAAQGPDALMATLSLLEQGKLEPEVQDDSLANYAHKLLKHESWLDWTLPAETLERRIRAFNPFPVAAASMKGDRIRVLEAQQLTDTSRDMAPGTLLAVTPDGLDVACGEQALRLNRIQLPGKKAMTVRDILNGQPDRFVTGQQFDPVEAHS